MRCARRRRCVVAIDVEAVKIDGPRGRVVKPACADRLPGIAALRARGEFCEERGGLGPHRKLSPGVGADADLFQWRINRLRQQAAHAAMVRVRDSPAAFSEHHRAVPDVFEGRAGIPIHIDQPAARERHRRVLRGLGAVDFDRGEAAIQRAVQIDFEDGVFRAAERGVPKIIEGVGYRCAAGQIPESPLAAAGIKQHPPTGGPVVDQPQDGRADRLAGEHDFFLRLVIHPVQVRRHIGRAAGGRSERRLQCDLGILQQDRDHLPGREAEAAGELPVRIVVDRGVEDQAGHGPGACVVGVSQAVDMTGTWFAARSVAS